VQENKQQIPFVFDLTVIKSSLFHNVNTLNTTLISGLYLPYDTYGKCQEARALEAMANCPALQRENSFLETRS